MISTVCKTYFSYPDVIFEAVAEPIIAHEVPLVVDALLLAMNVHAGAVSDVPIGFLLTVNEPINDLHVHVSTKGRGPPFPR